jgi:thiamine-monophosphate kinase
MDSSLPRTGIEQLGEFGLIEFLTKNLVLKQASTKTGVGDDAAVLQIPSNKQCLLSTDMLVEGVHFDLTYMPLKHLGYKAVMVNLSDIAAMNGTPKQITVSIALSNRFSLEAVDQLYQGIYLACQKYDIDLVGGDTTSSVHGLIISITVVGEAEEEKITYRNGAKLNDLIVVSGDLGSAYLGLQLLEREKNVFFETGQKVQPDLQGYEYLLERQLKPEARIDVVELLAEAGIKPNAMIDISDGLSSELLHLCKQSGLGCTIYEEKIPIDPTAVGLAHEFTLDPTTCALNGGEDYELLFTIDLKDYEKIKNMPDLTVIGHITEKEAGCNLVTRGQTQHPLTAQGWNALLNKKDEEEEQDKNIAEDEEL